MLSLDKFPVLLVEDDAGLSDLVKQVLRSLGFTNVTTAANGRIALERSLERNFKIILTDWEMKPMSGIEFVRYLRTLVPPPNRYAPVLMFTGRTSLEDVQYARDAGVNEFLAKPFSASELSKRLLSSIQHPRQFITAEEYAGPDRRRKRENAPDGKFKRAEDMKP
jgi:CheY-like chemotaxis protein